MATTSPDNIYSPDSGDLYALTVDLAAMADSVQSGLDNVRGEMAAPATQTEVNAGVDTEKFVTPSTLAARTIPHEEWSVSGLALSHNSLTPIPSTIARVASRSTVSGLGTPVLGGLSVGAGMYLLSVSMDIDSPTGLMERAFIEVGDTLPSQHVSRIAGVQGGENKLSGSIQVRMQAAGTITIDVYQTSNGASRNVALRVRLTQLN